MWRSRYTSEKPYEDGKWRWMLFDVNTSAFLGGDEDHDTLAYVLEESKMFANLYTNQTFRETFSKRILEMADTVFDVSVVESKIDEYEALMAVPMEKNHQRFFGENNEKFYGRVERMKEFAMLRRPYVEKMLIDNSYE